VVVDPHRPDDEEAEDEAAAKRGEFEKLYQEKDKELSSQKPIIDELKTKAERLEAVVLKQLDDTLGRLDNANRDRFNELFGFVEDPVLKYDRLLAYLSDKNSSSVPFILPGQGKPASQVKDDPTIKRAEQDIKTGTLAERRKAQQVLEEFRRQNPPQY